ncbi:Putative phospholipid-transporting ATPase C24B11.12c, partial [Termitomyces sp. J132]
IFFLAIAILQFFNKFSTISPGLVILPLLIVLGITALKDGYEDVKRHQSDRRVNHTPVRVLSGGNWANPNAMAKKNRTFVRGMIPTRLRKKPEKGQLVKPTTASDIMTESGVEHTDVEYDDAHETGSETGPGLHLFGHHANHSRPHWRKGIWVPADILICASSEEENVAFVETKNLDGETNLKSRHACAPLTHLRTAADCADVRNRFRVDADRPDVNMYKLNATLRMDSKDVEETGRKKGAEETHPIDMQMTLLRGTVLRNTAWVIGIVMYTGEDTRIVMNSGGTPSKRSKVERQMNPQVFINLIILAIMAVVCAIVDSVLEHHYFPRNAPWLFLDNQSDDNPSINGLVTWAFALITFQNIVPISLYISIEFVRTCQAAFIYFDSEIYYKKTDQATLARSWNLSDDLGQIEYIFSDKTGTLTQNSMVFRQCSIAGKVYHGDTDVEEESRHPSGITSGKASTSTSQTLTIPASSSSSSSSTAASTSSSPPVVADKPSVATGPATMLPPRSATRFVSHSLTDDLRAAGHASDPARARTLNGFFTVLALCHTVLTGTDPETGALEYKAQSPDEAALVQAAADVGYVFRGREVDVLSLQTPFSEDDGKGTRIERYRLLNILEFTSARKRMSVVVRKMDEDDGRVFLLCKGADNVIFERLKEGGGGEGEEREETERHLGEFASEGLRTLTLAYKVIPEEEYEEWSERYHEATVAMEGREEKIEAVSDELERDLRLLGATAIEDRLQDGVPETIADLKRAGIKIWVATGDKLETAIAIGHSTNLIGRESNIIVIRGDSGGRPVYQQMARAAEEFFPEANLLPSDVDYPPPRYSTSSRTDYQLRRINTGLSSIVGSNNGERPGGFVLVIDGSALEHALADDEHKSLLLRLATLCEGVVCCRVSPLQKALIVRLVKNGLGVMTLAIGDGANDVSMIQSADVGVGISGEEGLQAVNSSDYAIAQFRFLKRLLLVHGHWSYARNGNMILNFFYKNIVCIGVLWWFQIYCGWSSNYAFEYTFLLFWNSFWTIAPVIAIGIFDRIVDAHVLMDLPELYRYGREGRWFGLKWFTVYMLDAVFQSAIIFFLILYAYFSPSARTDGWQVALNEFSTADAVYASISPGWFVTPMYGYNHFLWPSAYFWLCLPLTVCLALAPRYIAKAWKFGFSPDDIDIMRYIGKTEPERDIAKDAYISTSSSTRQFARPSSSRRTSHTSLASERPPRPSFDPRNGSRTDMSTGMRSVHRGFDFSMEEGGVAMQRIQTNLSERRCRESSRNLAATTKQNTNGNRRRGTLRHVFSVRRGFLRKKPSTSDGR